MPGTGNLRDEIRQELETIKLLDTHEHLEPEEEFLTRHVDFGRLFYHYASSDLVSAGMPADQILAVIYDTDRSPEDKWQSMSKYWDAASNTAYCRCIERAIADLYGYPGLNGDTVAGLSAAMAANRRPGYYRSVFDRAGIERAMWHRLTLTQRPPLAYAPDYDRDLFVADIVGNDFVEPRAADKYEKYTGKVGPSNVEQDRAAWLAAWELREGRDFDTFESYLAMSEAFLARYAEEADALKFNLAYSREILFTERPASEIRPIYGRMRRGLAVSEDEFRAFQDYVVHYLVRLCGECGLVVKFHTGLQEGNGNLLANARPILLNNLFLQYPRVRFDLFHLGYPYHEEAGILAKVFPNVYADFCWVWIINPAAGRRILAEYLEMVPANKILGFGGDFITIEGCYAHAVMAKDNLARVLAEKVTDGAMSRGAASRVGRMLLRENAVELFGL